MYFSSPTKQLTVCNFLAVPAVSHSVWHYPFYWVPALFSVVFGLIALGEIIRIIWNHFHPDRNWE